MDAKNVPSGSAGLAGMVYCRATGQAHVRGLERESKKEEGQGTCISLQGLLWTQGKSEAWGMPSLDGIALCFAANLRVGGDAEAGPLGPEFSEGKWRTFWFLDHTLTGRRADGEGGPHSWVE